MEASDYKTSTNLPQLQPLVTDNGAAVITHSSKPTESIPPEEVKTDSGPNQRPQLDSEAHRRWRTSISIDFLNSVSRIDIHKTHCQWDNVVLYELEIHRNPTSPRQVALQSDPNDTTPSNQNSNFEAQASYSVVRSFFDFEVLRGKIVEALGILPQCTCQYCVEFVLYTRYKWGQPRGVVKITTGVRKRKKLLAAFIRDVLAMGKRRVKKTGKYKCHAQEIVPSILESFLSPQT
ncbi:Phox homologous domain [Phytophthora cinnamomi]|uniref:Phox homologous domain n=1 Tax=Phytophthora cinnamomi TaxID=4785 RepID=UPI003559C647|nr:Phox homologous domain [Phytophthora cinnamomi]